MRELIKINSKTIKKIEVNKLLILELIEEDLINKYNHIFKTNKDYSKIDFIVDFEIEKFGILYNFKILNVKN